MGYTGGRMKRLKTYLTDEHGVYKWEWVVLGLLLMIPFISFAYGDLKSIIHYEINFTGSILKGGGLQNFYTYCMNQVKFYIIVLKACLMQHMISQCILYWEYGEFLFIFMNR